jgi:transcription termination factor Rho
MELAKYRALPHFQDLVSINPSEAFHLSGEGSEISLRVIDIIAPVGKGQRGLIVSPPKAGKTTLLEHLGKAILQRHPEVHLILLLVDERPEEVTHFRRVVPAEVLASTSDSSSDSHIRLSRLAIERSKRLVEAGRDVVILLDSLTRLGRASNREMGPGGRTMSGGVDNRALQFPRQFFGAARNCEGSGSLTILATALIETGSRMDEVIFQEFKGTGNMELILDRAIADRRIFPAVDVLRSGTRREELLVPPEELVKRHLLRRALADLSPVEAGAVPDRRSSPRRRRTPCSSATWSRPRRWRSRFGDSANQRAGARVKVEHHSWHSPRLGRDMGIRVYGHWGPPLLVFPDERRRRARVRGPGHAGYARPPRRRRQDQAVLRQLGQQPELVRQGRAPAPPLVRAVGLRHVHRGRGRAVHPRQLPVARHRDHHDGRVVRAPTTP